MSLRYRTLIKTQPIVNPFTDATIALSLQDLGLGATNVVKVRRSTDNVEQDFTATQVTDGSLTTFCGGGDGFVTVWYDQKGVYDASQTNTASQPKIVNAGALILEGGKPSVFVSESNQLNYSLINAKSIIAVTTTTIDAPVRYLLYNSNLVKGLYLGGTSSSIDGIGIAVNGTVHNTGNSFVGRNLLYANHNGTFYNMSLNNNVEVSLANTGVIDVNQVGRLQEGDFSIKGNLQELLLFNTNQSSNKFNLINNINSRYNIY